MRADELVEVRQCIGKVAVDNGATVGEVFIECRTVDRIAYPQGAVDGIDTFETVARCRLSIERKHRGLYVRQHDLFLLELWVR
ncbi:hypothetical protein D3C80_969900 [compost metagenome]